MFLKRYRIEIILLFVIVFLLFAIYQLVSPSYIKRIESAYKKFSPEIYYVHEKNGLENQYLLNHKIVQIPDDDLFIIFQEKQWTDLKTSETYGVFDGETGIIYLNGSKILDDKYNENWVKSILCDDEFSYKNILRHEYGHAFLQDYLILNLGDYENFIANTIGYYFLDNNLTLVTQNSTDNFLFMYPKEIKNLINIYKNSPKEIYGYNFHYTENFHEFFAESYKRYLLNESIPDEFELFFNSCFK